MSLGVGFTYDKVRELCQKVTEEIHDSERSSLTNLDFRSEGFIPHFSNISNIEKATAFKKYKISTRRFAYYLYY